MGPPILRDTGGVSDTRPVSRFPTAAEAARKKVIALYLYSCPQRYGTVMWLPCLCGATCKVKICCKTRVAFRIFRSTAAGRRAPG